MRAIARGQPAVHTLRVERLQLLLGGLAERRGLADEHGHRLAARGPAGAARRRPVVGAGGEIGELLPERRPVLGERLLGGLALERAPEPRAAPDRHLPELRERVLGLRHALLGRPEPPGDRRSPGCRSTPSPAA